jgi:transcriptional regulator with XRE-family HTH domain
MKSTYTETYKKLLTRLVAARKQAGITQEALSKKLGRPQSFVSKIENGERRIDVVELLEIAGYINIDACELIQELQYR